MFFSINGTMWKLQYKNPSSVELRRSDGVYTLGVTDNTTKTVTIADGQPVRSNDRQGTMP